MEACFSHRTIKMVESHLPLGGPQPDTLVWNRGVLCGFGE